MAVRLTAGRPSRARSARISVLSSCVGWNQSMAASAETARAANGPAPSAYDEVRLVEVDGQVLRVGRRRGDARSARPLLIFNGIGANLEMLEPFVQALQDIEVVAFDVPGAGASPAPTYPYRYRHIAVLADRMMSELGYGCEVDVLGVS